MKRSRSYRRDKLGRFAPANTVTRKGGRRDAPTEPHVLQVGRRRVAFTDSNKATDAYAHHIKSTTGSLKKGDVATVWNNGRVQVK